MANSFGTYFKMTTWGESHGEGIGVVIDGCPAGLEISESEINRELMLRSPGKNAYTSPRKEADQAEILSGVYEGVTTGAPLSIFIKNTNADSSAYEPIKHILRPGHANYTYQKKYGLFDSRGGGRASARETACRVAAGAIAKKILRTFGIETAACIKQIGGIDAELDLSDMALLRKKTYESPIYCPDLEASELIAKALQGAIQDGDSLGGVVEFGASGLMVGLGDPVYGKLDAKLGLAMMSLPAAKGFEIGSGFSACRMKGSEHNDIFFQDGQEVKTKTNFSGGVLGGISNGMPVFGRVAFKPTSSIKKELESIDFEGNKTKLIHTQNARHDPCVAIRAVPVVDAMLALTLVDALLCDRVVRL